MELDEFGTSVMQYAFDFYFSHGRYDEAERYAQLALQGRTVWQGTGDVEQLADLAVLYKRLGRGSESEGAAEKAARLASEISNNNSPTASNYLENFIGAILATVADDNETAIEYLERYVDRPVSFMTFRMIEKHPAFDELRGDARFEEVVATMRKTAHEARARMRKLQPG